MKRILLLSVVLLASCGSQTEAVTPPATEALAADRFLTELRADYPVTLSPIAEGVWVHTTHYTLPGQAPIPVNGLVVIDGEAVTLIDAAWGELATLSLIDAVREETGLPVTRLVVTHHHADRTQGVDAAEREGLEVFTHPDTPTLAARAGWPVPNTSVAALDAPQSRTRVGKIELAFPGHGHAPDNLIAYLPDSNILYAGCAVRGAESRTLGNTLDADLPLWRESLLWTKATYPNTQTVVPGHGKGANLSLIDATVALIDAELGQAN
ncbi:subclass B1 metallo-beta-lactamase [Algimonas porphyrae]|uniref:beta-lactamase n=1 Tax=Algimonas porphyrae TaxID=1128113 RepID=A0ABQ5V0B9_9PROT|nr:subclass B1 metallo-beta-lactamase [Algimonas porphyrae]GLQ19687.1 beta-lactamase [Algimonas porphyrae]